MTESVETAVPNHVGLILDGNRRWAKQHGLPTYEGHRQGYLKIKEISQLAFQRGIKYLTVYAFSTENWSRSKKEVEFLMNLILQLLVDDLLEFHDHGYKVVWLGSEDRLTSKLVKALNNAVELTKNNTKGTFCLCFNYGGQLEIAEGVKRMMADGVKPDEVNEAKITEYLYSPDVPPIDIMVRTSGEQRISNFMLWRVAYSELMFITKHWPDFNEQDLDEVINEYNKRNRRFGA